MNWFKAPPGIVHKVQYLSGVRMNKYDLVAYCGRRKLTDEIYNNKPDNEEICTVCLELSNPNQS
jgi:hypothetical protein